MVPYIPVAEQLLLLQVGRDEDVGGETGRRGVSGDGVGQIAGRRAADGLESELDRLGRSHCDHPVLERVGGVGGVVLDPDLGVDAKPLGQAVGADQRRQTGLQGIARAALEGKEIGVAPDPPRAGLNPPPRFLGIEAGIVVGDLERAEALAAYEQGLQWVGLPALLASQALN